jgi:hypothetical protein
VQDQNIDIIGSDSYQLAISKLKLKENEFITELVGDHKEYFINYKKIEFLKKWLTANKNKIIILEFLNEFIKLCNGDTKIYLKTENVEYLPYKDIIEQRKNVKLKLEINKNELFNVIKKSKQMFNNSFIEFKKEKNKKIESIIYSNLKNEITPNYNINIIKDNMNEGYKFNFDYTIKFNIDIIYKVLNNISKNTEKINLEFIGDIHPAFIEDNNILHVFMPTR